MFTLSDINLTVNLPLDRFYTSDGRGGSLYTHRLLYEQIAIINAYRLFLEDSGKLQII